MSCYHLTCILNIYVVYKFNLQVMFMVRISILDVYQIFTKSKSELCCAVFDIVNIAFDIRHW